MAEQAPEGLWLSEIFTSWQGEGVRNGEQHLFVRSAGCNLRCRWCDTPASLVRVSHCEVTAADGAVTKLKNPVSFADLAAICSRAIEDDPSIAMIALTGGEPMVQADGLSRWLGAYPPERPCLLETNGVVLRGLAEVLPEIALVSADLKLPSNTGEGDLWSQHEEFLAVCRRLGTPLYLKVPVDEGTDHGDILRAAKLVAASAPDATLYVQPLTEPEGDRWTISSEGLQGAVALFRKAGVDARMGVQLHKMLGVR